MIRRIAAAVALIAGLIGGMAAGAAVAGPTGVLGKIERDEAWQHQHTGYPVVPSGEAKIRATFGSPCSSDANANAVLMFATDDQKPYRVNFHRKLGGTDSSNLDHDVTGHLAATKLERHLKSGIWGYACRYKRGSSTQYSAHAWGIAVDVNSAYERPGESCHTLPTEFGRVWTDHRWSWGKTWNDCMHFQYATGY